MVLFLIMTLLGPILPLQIGLRALRQLPRKKPLPLSPMTLLPMKPSSLAPFPRMVGVTALLLLRRATLIPKFPPDPV